MQVRRISLELIATILLAEIVSTDMCVPAMADDDKSNASPVKSVEAIDYNEKRIYHSPETPGYTCWVGLWQLADGRIRCSFEQRIGPKDNVKKSSPNLESLDGGETWKLLSSSIGSGRGMVVLNDHTFLRPNLQRSTDGGKTWSDRSYLLPTATYFSYPTLIRPLRDGRLVLMGGYWKRDDVETRVLKPYPNSRLRKMIFISSDEGKTWSKPIELMSIEDGVCEESDFCELPNGDLFWVHRCELFPGKMTKIHPLAHRHGSDPASPWMWFYSDRKQSITRKKGNMFVPEKSQVMPAPHSGFPMVLYTRENLILNFQTDGIYWTADVGKHWQKLNIPGTKYYPKALQLSDGKIICIGHVGSDNPYGTVDQSIVQQTFRLKVVR